MRKKIQLLHSQAPYGIFIHLKKGFVVKHHIYYSILDRLYMSLSILDLLTHMQKGGTVPGDQVEAGDGGQQGTKEEEDRVTELPEIPQLQHLAKNRPKRPKKHASTKNVVKVNQMHLAK